MENNFGWSKLIALMDTLKNNSSRLPSIMDIDRAIWMHAFNSVFSNYDSYTGSFSQNYYLYEDDFGRMLPVIWDLNMSIGGFPGGSGGGTHNCRQDEFIRWRDKCLKTLDPENCPRS